LYTGKDYEYKALNGKRILHMYYEGERKSTYKMDREDEGIPTPGR